MSTPELLAIRDKLLGELTSLKTKSKELDAEIASTVESIKAVEAKLSK